MSIVEYCAIISAAGIVLNTIITIFNNWQIRIVHRATNSMKDELVHETREAADAIGQARGIQMERDRRLNR